MLSRQRATRLVVLLALASAAAFAPKDALQVWRDIRNARATPRAERALAPAHQVGIGAALQIAEAAAVIPADAVYVLLTGPGARLRDPRSADYVKSWAAFRLLPRRRADTVANATWVLAYGDALRIPGVRYRRIVDIGDGVRAGEVLR